MNSSDQPIDPVSSLRSVDVFQDLSEEHFAKLGEFTVCELLPAKAVIFREGDPPKYIYFIERGHVALEIQIPGGGHKRLHTVGEGELLGWTPALGQSRMALTARTLDPTRVCRIDAKQVLALCEQNPRFGYEFMRRTAWALAQRLVASRLQLLDVYRHELPHIEDADAEGEANPS